MKIEAKTNEISAKQTPKGTQLNALQSKTYSNLPFVSIMVIDFQCQTLALLEWRSLIIYKNIPTEMDEKR